jgi:hypothetical protein
MKSLNLCAELFQKLFQIKHWGTWDMKRFVIFWKE